METAARGYGASWMFFQSLQFTAAGSNMSDDSASMNALVDRLKAGDQTALAELLEAYRAMLRRMIELRLDPRLAGRLSASDVLQEVYLDAAQRVRHFQAKPEMPFVVWLRIITGQRLVDLHRQHLGAQRRDARAEVSIDDRGLFSASSMCLAAQLVGRLTSPSQAARGWKPRPSWKLPWSSSSRSIARCWRCATSRN